MFSGFANVWTPVTPSRSLRGKPLAVKLAGEPLVLFRDGRGKLGALLDRCPHRGVALSLGEINADGYLACPFHGWSFKADGACARIPLNDVPAAKRERYAATAVPVREVGGLVWVFTGLDPAGKEPEPAPGLLDPAWHTAFFAEMWGVHWTRAMENMLDIPHVPFVHRRSIGRPMRKRMRPSSVLRTSIRPEPWGGVIQGELDGVRTRADLVWRRPNSMELVSNESSSRGLLICIYCVPVAADRTQMILGVGRTFLRNNPLGWISDRISQNILFEDRAVVESSQPSEVPPPGEEVSVANDGPTLHFRHYYYRELRGSSAELSSLRSDQGKLRRDEPPRGSDPGNPEHRS
jgi:phenylpropionate dioxygenase-like ring-hydroxylating dioxygenase large terminal subunit